MAITSRVAAVTGANKGIGLAIVRNLALAYPTSPLHAGPLTIYLTARSSSRGAEAVSTLEHDPALKEAAVLAQDGGDVTIKFHALDISDGESIRAFRDALAKDHPEGIDAVVNNAGIALQGFDSAVVRDTLQTNYHGSLQATQDLLPLLRREGRLVNVCSMSGSLSKYSPEIRTAFLNAAAQNDLAGVTALMDKFTTAVEEGREKEAGFPSAAYAVSKAGEIAMTKVVAGLEKEGGGGRLVNACCPGYVKTDMTRGGGAKTPDEGAMTPVLLALGEFGGKTGGFWQGEKEIEW
ncbi:hypothetical protein Q7P37_004868 [Cladosporium fusiforme]